MRCSSCEPLLDAYLEGTLPRREAAGVAAHVAACADCASLMRELRVIDALLTTARTSAVHEDFTASVVSATHATPLRSRRRIPLAAALLLYLGVAWTLAAIVLRSQPLGALAAKAGALVRHDAGAIGAAFHAVAPATPLIAAAVTVVLLVDILLLAAVIYAHRRVRPLLALHLHQGDRS
jgi:anti-sigma factor RsiW